MMWIRELLCKIFGHKKPYIEKMNHRICKRCRLVMEYFGVLKFPARRLR